jgi:hypothetical protein
VPEPVSANIFSQPERADRRIGHVLDHLPAIVVTHQELGKSGQGDRLTLLQRGIDRVLQDVFRSRPPVIGYRFRRMPINEETTSER